MSLVGQTKTQSKNKKQTMSFGCTLCRSVARPTRQRGDAGFDVRMVLEPDFLDKQPACERPHIRVDVNDRSVTVDPGRRVVLPTGLVLSCPPQFYFRVSPRSSLALLFGAEVLAGVVDSSYRDEVLVILKNGGSQPLTLHHLERVAQVIPTRIEGVDLLADEASAAGGLARRGGFGSTGRF